ncbi:hypothetical protein ES703_70603 [subsurface metagenome]
MYVTFIPSGEPGGLELPKMPLKGLDKCFDICYNVL